jgi:hypothetical protein
MIVDRYGLVKLFEFMPTLMVDIEPEIRELDCLLESLAYQPRGSATAMGAPPDTVDSTAYMPGKV